MSAIRPLSRTFVLESKEDVATCAGFIRSLVIGTPGWRVSIEPDRPQMTHNQRKREWALWRYIAEHAWVDKRQFSAEGWRGHYCGMFIGYEEQPNGDYIPLGTSHLDTKQHNDFLERVMADAASNHGIDFKQWEEHEQ
jgi:hypothetical protein